MPTRPQALLVPVTTNAVLRSQITGRSNKHTRQGSQNAPHQRPRGLTKEHSYVA
jgi:hypothetical protein